MNRSRIIVVGGSDEALGEGGQRYVWFSAPRTIGEVTRAIYQIEYLV